MIPGFKIHQEHFRTYTQQFLCADEDQNAPYRLKIQHTYRVVAHSLHYSAALPAPIRLAAALAALYHDIGRFSQFAEYGTFHDAQSCNHARRSVDVLQKAGFLPPQTPHRAAIIKAIHLHNRKALDAPLRPEEAFFYHLLRDCDKTDVLSVLKGHYQSAGDRNSYLTLGLDKEDRISQSVLNTLRSGNIVDIGDVSTRHDFKLLQIGWIYDFHFLESYRFVLGRNDFRDILATIPSDLLPQDFIDSFDTMLKRETEKKRSIIHEAREAGLYPFS